MRALDRVSFSIGEGEYAVLCGPSGCGKTTLIRHAKPGLIPVGAREGRVLYRDGDVESLAQEAAAGEIGFVQQNPDNQIVTDFVWHELAFGPENLGLPVPMIRRRVAEMAAFFGMEGWFRKKTGEISGGQKQMLNLASALVMDPKLLILDEPTSMLDPLAAKSFLDALARVNKELGVAVLVSEHRLDDILPVADTLVTMERGRIVACAAPGEIAASLSNASEEGRIYFAMPDCVRIFAQLGCDELPLSVRDARTKLRGLMKDTGPQRAAERGGKSTAGVEALAAQELWFRYEGHGRDVLRGASLTLKKGEFACLLGGNGAGKTTLLRALAGLEKPYRGKTKRAKDTKLCMLPQNARALFCFDTVERELLESAQENAAKAAQMAERMGLAPLLDRHPYDLSGGETQRLALGKLLLRDADVLLLDEPTKGLDAYAKRELALLFAELTRCGVSLLCVTHDAAFAAQYATRCLMLFDGYVISEDEPHAFFAGNRFYTTPANLIAKDYFPYDITSEEVASSCKSFL